MHLFLAVLGLCCFTRFHLVSVNGGYSLVAVHSLFNVAVTLVVEHGLQSQASVVAVPRL